MFDDWRRFASIARNLKNAGDTKPGMGEAFYRCAVSRFYYAAYHVCQAKHAYVHPPKAGSGMHRGYFDYLANQGQQELSDLLNELHNMRVNADYDSRFETVTEDVSEAETTYQKIVALL